MSKPLVFLCDAGIIQDDQIVEQELTVIATSISDCLIAAEKILEAWYDKPVRFRRVEIIQRHLVLSPSARQLLEEAEGDCTVVQAQDEPEKN